MANDAHHSREALCMASILWFFWLLSALPLPVLISEFGHVPLGACENMGWYYARLHSHVFLYPVTFGLVSTVFLTLHWVKSWDHLRKCLSNDLNIKIVALIVVAILLVTGISGSFSSIPAIWSFAPDYKVLDKINVDEKGKDTKKLRKKIEEQYYQNDRKKFEKTIEKTIEKETIEKITEKTTEKITEKIQLLRNQWKNAPFSYTEVFYRIGHLAMTILFCLLFTTGFLVTTSPEAKGSKAKVPETYVWFALFFAFFWVLMRVTFLFEEQSLYGNNPLLELHGAFLILFVGLFVLLPLLRYRNYKKNGKDNNKGEHCRKKDHDHSIWIVIGFAEGGIAVLEFGGVAQQIGTILVYTFGTGSSIWSYFSMFTVILVFALLFLLLLQHLGKESSEVHQNTQG